MSKSKLIHCTEPHASSLSRGKRIFFTESSADGLPERKLRRLLAAVIRLGTSVDFYLRVAVRAGAVASSLLRRLAAIADIRMVLASLLRRLVVDSLLRVAVGRPIRRQLAAVHRPVRPDDRAVRHVDDARRRVVAPSIRELAAARRLDAPARGLRGRRPDLRRIRRRDIVRRGPAPRGGVRHAPRASSASVRSGIPVRKGPSPGAEPPLRHRGPRAVGGVRLVPARAVCGGGGERLLLVGLVVLVLPGLPLRRGVRAGGEPHPAVQPEHRRGGHHRLGDDRGRQLLRVGPLRLRGVVDRVLPVVLLARHDIPPSGFARERGRRFAEGRRELAVVAQIAQAGESQPSNDEATTTREVGLARQEQAQPRQQEWSGRLAAVVASIQGFP